MARTTVRGPVYEKLEVRPLTLFGIEGHLRRFNDAVFQPALPNRADPSALAQQKTLVFFGGDIQNLSHLMDQGDKTIDYRKWCLEAAALRLGDQFPSHHVVVIKPSRVVFEHVSCFDNFVETNFLGIPNHVYHYESLLHLEKLLKMISLKIKRMDSDALFKMLLRTLKEENLQETHKIEEGTVRQYETLSEERRRMLLNWQKTLRLHRYPLTLVAFSKGCVVLNQFLYEFHFARGLEPNHLDSGFIERIRAIYWLDAGHCGRHYVYLTSMGLLRTLSHLEIKVHVHTSMYMTEDEKRPWIKQQYNEFTKALSDLNIDALTIRHVGMTEDLQSHFNVLLKFKKVENSHCNKINSPKVRRQRKLPPMLEAPASAQPIRQPRPTPEVKFRDYKREIIGLSLINRHDSPYLGLQMILRKPGSSLRASQARLSCPPNTEMVETVPARYKPTTTNNKPSITPQMPSTSAQMQSSAPMQSSFALMQPSSATMQPSSAPMQFSSAPMQFSSAPMQPSSAPMHSSSAQMPSTSAEPSTSAQMPSTSDQNPSTVTQLWTSDLFPKPDKNYQVLVMNELNYAITNETEAQLYLHLPHCEMYGPVVALPNYRTPLRMQVYTSEKEKYEPIVYNHHYLVDSDNKDDVGEDLPDYFDEHTERAAAEGLDPAASGSSSSDASGSDTSNSDSSSSSGASTPALRPPDSRSGLGLTLTGSSLIDAVSDILAFSERVASDSGPTTSNSGPGSIYGTGSASDPGSTPESGLNASDPGHITSGPGSTSDPGHITSDSGPNTSDLGHITSGPGSTFGNGSTSGSNLTGVYQLNPNTAADQAVRFQQATSHSTTIAQPNLSRNRVNIRPRNQIASQLTQSDSRLTSSSQDSVAPRAGTSGPRVRFRNDDESPCRYNLRKRIKRSYNEDNFSNQYQ